MADMTRHDTPAAFDGANARGAAPERSRARRREGGREADGRDRAACEDRRRYTVETLRRSLVEPRRLHARRREDRRYPLLDRFDAGMLALAVLLVGFSILDSLFTLMLLARGGSELNPVMNAVLDHGIWAFTAVKMTLTAVPAVLLVATGNLPLWRGLRARSVLAALVGLYAGLILYELALLSLG